MSNSPKLRIAIVAFAISMIIYSLDMYLSLLSGGLYGSPKMLLFMLPAEIIVIALSSFVIIKYFSWNEIGINIPKLNTTLWVLPVYLVLAAAWIIQIIKISNSEISSEQWKDFMLIGLVTMTVGIAEEFMHRGIILGALLERTSKSKAILISALFFSALHSINIIGGISLTQSLIQLFLTFIAGLYLAGVRLKMNSILPLIIWHWLWDFYTLSTNALGLTPSTIANLNILIELVIGLVILFQFRRQNQITT